MNKCLLFLCSLAVVVALPIAVKAEASCKPANASHEGVDNESASAKKEKPTAYDLVKAYEQVITHPTPETVNLLTEEGYSLLDLVVITGDLKGCKRLIAVGADVNRLNTFEVPSLYYAEDAAIIEVLRGQGAMLSAELLNKEDSTGHTLLTIAAEYNNLSRVKMLCEMGASLNHQDHWGWTPVMYAACPGSLTRALNSLLLVGTCFIALALEKVRRFSTGRDLTVQYLLEQGANPLLKGKKSKQWFCEEYKKEMAEASYNLLSQAVNEQQGVKGSVVLTY